jgi:hypothetical protein
MSRVIVQLPQWTRNVEFRDGELALIWIVQIEQIGVLFCEIF